MRRRRVVVRRSSYRVPRSPELASAWSPCPSKAISVLLNTYETSSWTMPPLVRDSFSMIGSAIGGVAGAFYGFNHVMPVVQRRIKGPMWIHFLLGAPPVIVFSSACAGLAGGTIPAAAQLVSSAAMSSPSFDRSASPATVPSPSFTPSSSQDDMHKRSSSPL